MNITFENINHYGVIVLENELFQHIHHPEMPLMYDANYIRFKRMPTLPEFIEAEDYLKTFHFKHSQKHVKFLFPGDRKIPEELLKYLLETQHLVGSLELYTIHPNQFPPVKDDPDIVVQPVTQENVQDYLSFQYSIDVKFGVEYAIQRLGQHMRNFQSNQVLQIIAFYRGIPAGTVDVIISADTAEIDNLGVLESFQRRGIGSRLQKYVLNIFSDRTIILVASGEDTAREMYQKQNYQYLGVTYEVMKVYE